MNRKISLKLLDNYKRKFFIKNEIKIKFLLFNKNKSLNLIDLESTNFIIKKSSNFFKKTKINNKCLVTGRSYNVSTKFKMSRFEFRNNLKKYNFSNTIKY